jgi:hypothetical protein
VRIPTQLGEAKFMLKLQGRNPAQASIPFSRGDWNGFLTLVTDNLTKIVLLPVILIGTFAPGFLSLNSGPPAD